MNPFWFAVGRMFRIAGQPYQLEFVRLMSRSANEAIVVCRVLCTWVPGPHGNYVSWQQAGQQLFLRLRPGRFSVFINGRFRNVG